MKIAAAYIRVSTEDQTEYSPDSQIKQIFTYAKHHDMIIPEEFIFVDEGISGKSTKKRSEFNRMIGLAKQKPKPFDAILLWKFSRFARNRQDSVVYKAMLRKQLGIDVISVSEQLGDDKTSILIEALIEAMDEYYSINLAEEVKRGMTEKATRGEPVCFPAFGYDIKDKKYIVNPDEAPIVKKIFEDFLNGQGFRDLAVKINSIGITTKRGNKFENRTIEYILNNPIYIGKIRWNPTGKTCRNYHDDNIIIVDGSHEPIIDLNTWDAVQNRLIENKKLYQSHARQSNPKNPFMLQGLLRCSNCGNTLVTSTPGSLQCNAYAKGTCTVSHSITVKKIDRIVIDLIKLTIESKNFDLEIRQSSKSNSNNDILKRQIEKEHIKLERVKQAYENGIDTIEEYKANKMKIMNTIKELENRYTKTDIKAIKKAFYEKHKDVYKILNDPNYSSAEKNKILRSFIDRIEFKRSTGEIKLFMYSEI